MRIGKFKDKGRRFDIRGRLLGPQRERPEDIQRLLVRTASGEVVRLGELIRIEQEPTLQAITRRDRERAITIFANVATGASQAAAVDRSLAIARAVLPDGYRAVVAGSTKAFRESFQSLWFAFGLGLLDRLHGPRLAVQLVLAPAHGPPRAPVLHQRGALRPLDRRPEPQRLQHARAHPPRRHREEELDHARRLHEPGPRRGAFRTARRSSRRARSGFARS